MNPTRYAVVDIETTGSKTDQHGITEVAIYVFDGERIVDSFDSLVNPQAAIPPYITALTGIDDEMVFDAPTFEEVADRIDSITDGCIFVAHNVNFDYGFIKHQMGLLGKKYQRAKLCTARLARKVFPKLKSYSLGNLCEHLGISIEARHRAWGDARATVDLLSLIIDHDSCGHIGQALKKGSKEALLPPNLDLKSFHQLPAATGVYYFHDIRGEVLYVGMAGNILKRINGHFSSGSRSKLDQSLFNAIYDISFEVLGDELVAALVENAEIKRLWPAYNRALKRSTRLYGLYSFTDQEGYHRLQVAKTTTDPPPLVIYQAEPEGRYDLKSLCSKYRLCPRLCGLQKTNGACYDRLNGSCEGACEKAETADRYNDKVAQAISEVKGELGSFLVLGKGRDHAESTAVLIERGKYVGFGFIPKDDTIEDISGFMPYIKAAKDEADARKIIASYIRRGSGRRRIITIPTADTLD